MSSEETTAVGIAGARTTLKLGRWSASALAGLYVVYAATLFAGGVASGVPKDPYLALAELLTMAGALLQVVMVATIHACAPAHARGATLAALHSMWIMAGLTTSVHFVELTVARRFDVREMPGFARLFGWEWPSLLYAVELLAWHLFFGLSVLLAGLAFRGGGRERAVRAGLMTTGVLCLVGLVGPAVGNLSWRMIGVFGYGIVFPAVCVGISLVFRDAKRSE
jgi:hypothetical protein